MTSVLLALTPGPDVLLVVTIAAKEGFKKSLQLTLGLASGVVFHTSLIILGVSAAIITYPHAMKLVAAFGAVYLLYLAWLTWQHRQDAIDSSVQEISGSYYWRGVIMNISNPKVLLFFLALFPQFAQLDEPGYHWRIAILGLIFIAVTIMVFGGLAYLTAKSTQSFMQNPRFKKGMDYVTIGVFMLLAGLLLFSVF
ncbi:LysE family translocator [Marinicella litoralis]|uniref:Threonine/homoserine/homoserine lactone efflux protein n=2 Tax=Marinicella litoralis TaxID=644220 RepID=A0A4R6XVZ5_9GAMM|nr:LysE family translocator [Marinicella litoralis]TDR22600.1 threonine/homoserine/homoserine lactone efflux protein [Marinicella litoralis]